MQHSIDMAVIKNNLTELIRDEPKVHDWGDGLTSGGLTGDILKSIADYVINEFGAGKFRSLETGSGLSTMLFVAAQPVSHIAINPDIGVKDRIFAEMQKRKYDTRTLKYFTDFSEFILPDLAKTETVDIALIDGGHGWPAVFVDFCYANIMMRQGGIMIIDDILLFSCMQLFLLLKHQPGWALENVVYTKTAFFRKVTGDRLLPDFGGQPYILHNKLL